MHRIVSLLDDQRTELVEKLWAEMAQRFGVGNLGKTASCYAKLIDDRIANLLESR